MLVQPDRRKDGGAYHLKNKKYYEDIHFTCASCGKKDVWTANQQKKYFEDQNANIYNTAKWCYDCHLENMKRKY